jgi:hypothetical protein
MPVLKYSKREDIPADLIDSAKEDGNAFVVEVTPMSKFTELRTTAEQVSTERDTYKGALAAYKRVVGDDPSAFERELSDLRGTALKVKDGTLKGTDAIEAEVERRVKTKLDEREAQIANLSSQVGNLQNANRDLDGKYRRSIVDQAITNAVMGADSVINPTALPDVLHRAYSVFTVTDDGKVVAKDGDKIIYGSDGVTPLKPSEWLGKVVKEAPYLGKGSAGGGAAGGSESGKIAGMSQEAFYKLPPAERLALHRRAQKKSG